MKFNLVDYVVGMSYRNILLPFIEAVKVLRYGAVRSGSCNLSVDGWGFLERGDSRESHSRFWWGQMRPFSHIPGRFPGLQLATLLPAVQTNKAGLGGPPEPSRAKPSRDKPPTYDSPKNKDSPFLTPAASHFIFFQLVANKVCMLLVTCYCQFSCSDIVNLSLGSVCAAERHVFKCHQSLLESCLALCWRNYPVE